MITKFLTLLLLCCLLLTSTTVLADLPLHCEHHQIQGDWMVYMTAPNRRAHVPLACETLTADTFSSHKSLVVSLRSPNLVYRKNVDNHGEKKQKSPHAVVGKWTMVYDQGFEFSMNQFKFFAYNNFTRHEDSELITSYCAETSFGWYEYTVPAHHGSLNKKVFGCYMALKLNKQDSDTVTDLPVNKKLYQSEEERKELNTHSDAAELFADSHMVMMSDASSEALFKNDVKLVKMINEKQSLWRAKAYDRFEKMTNGQMKAYSGSTPSPKLNQFLDKQKRRSQRKSEEADAAVSVLSDNVISPFVKSNKRKSSLSSTLKMSDMPESWDWRNVSGVNYVSPVRDQGACGSCYAFAAIAALESRIRIMTNNREKAILAPQDVVSCSAYNQKCSGGFPYLIGKQTNDFSLVSEECFPYKGDASISCSKKCKNPRLRVTVNNDYEYIGGFYGAGNNEELMMKEIYTNGPIAVSYQVYPDFKYYEKGIYENVKAEKKRSATEVNKFEPTTHSVALVGWGIDKETNTKYWIAKNSWGKDWGMNGYFLMKKGTNVAAVEAQAVTPGIPVLHYGKKH